MTEWNIAEQGACRRNPQFVVRHTAGRRWLTTVMLVLLAAVILQAGCGVQATDLLARGDSFIVKGTATTRNVFAFGPCPAWVDTTGAVYQLFQGENVSNADFDRVTTTGVISRLSLTVRRDLIVGCSVGTTAVVDQVLEIIQ